MKFIYLLFLLLVLPSLLEANTDTLTLWHQIVKAEDLRSQGQLDSALTLLKTTRVQEDFDLADCSEKSMLFHKIGVYHYYKKQSEDALIYWRDSALQIRLSCFGKLHQETANSYYAVAMAYRVLGDRHEESKNILSSVRILESLPRKDTLGLAYKYAQVGVLYDRLGDYTLAARYLLQAKRYYEQFGVSNHRYVAELFRDLGVLNNHRGNYLEAIDNFKSSAEVYRQLDKNKYVRQIAECHQNTSKAFWKIGDYQTAEKYALQALASNKKQLATEAISTNYEVLGNIKKKQRAYVKAMAYFQESLRLRKQIADQRKIANAYENIADVQFEQGHYKEALRYYQSAISKLLPDFENTAFTDPPRIKAQLILNKLDLLRVLALKAEVHCKKYVENGVKEDLLSASRIYRSLDTLIVLIRQQYKASNSKFILAQQTRPIYERAIETALRLFKTTEEQEYMREAYLYSAKNKAIVLLDDLQDFDAKKVDIPPLLLEKENDIRKQNALLENEILHLGQSASRDSLLSVLGNRRFMLQREYDKLTEQLEKEHPDYYKLKYAFPEFSNIDQFQESLPANAAMIEYFVGARNIYIFVITKTDIDYYIALRPEGFGLLCHRFIAITSGSEPYARTAFVNSANSLFDLLLQKPLLGLEEGIERLQIIPDDLLLQISFDVLPFEKMETTNRTALPYLIKKYAIGSAYSGQLLSTSRKQKPGLSLFAGFGLEYDDFTLAGIKGIDSLTNGSLGKLLYSDDEVLEIAELLEGDVWVNAQASKSIFLAKAANYQLLHLAMHGLVDKEQPLHSTLVFTRKTDSTDYLLSAADLYALPLHAEMTTLSACNTGNGQLAPGEGIRSMARAFAYAGCPSLVASLWNASDFSNKQLLLSFYTYLRAGHTKDVALRLAKLDYLQQASPTHAEPAYWSHLILTGDPRSIDFIQPKFSVGLGVFVLIIGSIGLFLIWVIRKKNRFEIQVPK